MSHVTQGDTCFNEGQLDDIERAVAPYGGHLMRGQQEHKWFGRWVNDWNTPESAVQQGRDPKTFGKCAHAIRFDGVNYEIGLVREADGSLRPVYDNYGYAPDNTPSRVGAHDGQKLERMFGVGLKKLTDEVGAQVAIRMMARKGFRARRTIDSTTGDVLVQCQR